MKRSKQIVRRWAAALLVGTALAAGCDKPVNTVERAEPLGRPAPVADKRIICDSYLSGMAVICAVRQSVVSGNLLKIQVDVYNSYSNERQFNYKFEWYDDEGMSVDSPMSIWKPQTIEGGEKVTVTGIAPNPRCKDFRLKLQQSQNQ
jgi:uncharacterized protein YcfL